MSSHVNSTVKPYRFFHNPISIFFFISSCTRLKRSKSCRRLDYPVDRRNETVLKYDFIRFFIKTIEYLFYIYLKLKLKICKLLTSRVYTTVLLWLVEQH